MAVNRKSVRSSVWHVLVGACAVLSVLCVSLIATVVLIARHNHWQDVSDITNTNVRAKNVSRASYKMDPWEKNSRILPTIVPEHYKIHLNPDISAGTFSGTVDIDIQITGDTPYIPIHVKALEITSCKLYRNDIEVVVRKSFYSPKNLFWVTTFPESEPLQPGPLRMSFKFNGSLTSRIVGFYKSTYRSASGEPRSIATSKFEPVDARAAFPCFDEPALKANFTVSLVRPTSSGYSSHSNMNLEKEQADSDVTVSTFATSVKMSTYLVCFIVSDFETLGSVTVDNGDTQLPVQVFTTAQQKQNSILARNVAQKVTQYYINYFQIPYPLPKLDLFAIPDFVSGAMEHWGLITFRETALLFDENTNSASAQKRVALVVAHEIAHQWFGNLVTMAWWDDLWLNEGFASFMESKAINAAMNEFKDWSILEQVVLDDLQPVMDVDAAVNSHPIVQSVSNPDQINQLFDSVSYDKGQAVLRMLEDFLTPDVFEKGLQTYLSANKFNNARTEDLWANLNEAYGDDAVNVSDVMNTWTRQMGYPVVNVQRQGDSIVLTQERFLSDKDAEYDDDESPYRYTWDIPIKYSTSDHPTTQSQLVWFPRNATQISLPITNSVAFVKFNFRQVGFYRVNYQAKEWKVLAQNIAKFVPLDRAHLLNDVFSLASAGYTEYSIALDMLQYLSKESNYLPWASGLKAIYDLDILLADTPAYPDYRKFVLELVSPLYGVGPGKFSWDVPANDNHLNRLLRVKILGAACRFGLAQCISDVGELFQKWLNDQKTVISPDLRALVYTYGMVAVGNDANWEKTWALYLKETNAQERINILSALAYVNEPWIIEKYLNYAWLEDNVRSQDYFSVLGYVAGTPVGSPVVWDYYRTHWPDMVARFGLQHRYLGSCISSIISRFTSQTRLDELLAFYAKYPEAGAGEASRRNAEEKITTRVKWTDSNADEIFDWLKNH